MNRIRWRVVSGLLIAGPAILAAVLGWPYFQILVAVVACLMAWEWTGICVGQRSDEVVLIEVTTVLAVAVLSSTEQFVPALVTLLVASLLVVWVASIRNLRAPILLALGPCYIGLPTIAIMWLFAMPNIGPRLVTWTIFVVVATDVGAYLVGSKIGGPKLAPRISPKKTWAGLAGGVLAASAGGALFAWVFGATNALFVALVAVLLAIISQLGDLFESLVKRRFDVKDSSSIIPGHGGVLDRGDGIIAAVLAVAAWHLMSGNGGLTWQ